MLHLEEFVEAVQQKESVAGMMRFLVAHFKMVVHKIMPEGSPEEVQKLLEDDPDYFIKNMGKGRIKPKILEFVVTNTRHT